LFIYSCIVEHAFQSYIVEVELLVKLERKERWLALTFMPVGNPANWKQALLII